MIDSQPAPTYFELELPDLNKTIGSIPPSRLSRLNIQLLGSADKNLGYGDMHVRINRKGVSNVFNSGANERGKFPTMDLQKRSRVWIRSLEKCR
jgi:hypothetical protein